MSFKTNKVIYILILSMAVVGVTAAATIQNIQVSDGQSQSTININSNGGFVNLFETIYRLFMRLSLPNSLDNLYKGQVPETPGSPYVLAMFAMDGPFEGIAVNAQQGNIAIAKADFNEFKTQYQTLSNMVPEWRGYWDINLVNKLGTDLNNNNLDAAFQDIGNIGQSCDRCHGDVQPQVWAKYYWRDFNTVKVNTPEGYLPWTTAMTKYLTPAFAGIAVNLQEGKKQDALNDVVLFKTMMLNFKQACNNCHDTPRFYFVSDDVFSGIENMNENIQVGSFDTALKIQQQLGDNCIRCHVLHQPAQRMKDKMGFDLQLDEANKGGIENENKN